jgi:hypothetical protein
MRRLRNIHDIKAMIFKSKLIKLVSPVEDLVKVKVKQSRNRPGVPQRIPGGLGSQIFMTFGT